MQRTFISILWTNCSTVSLFLLLFQGVGFVDFSINQLLLPLYLAFGITIFLYTVFILVILGGSR